MRPETPFDPLFDDEAAFRLMVKFNVCVINNTVRRFISADCDFKNVKVNYTNDKKAATRRAICLAVIAEHS